MLDDALPSNGFDSVIVPAVVSTLTSVPKLNCWPMPPHPNPEPPEDVFVLFEPPVSVEPTGVLEVPEVGSLDVEPVEVAPVEVEPVELPAELDEVEPPVVSPLELDEDELEPPGTVAAPLVVGVEVGVLLLIRLALGLLCDATLATVVPLRAENCR